MIGFVLYVFSLVFVQLAHMHLMEDLESVDDEHLTMIFEHLGSVQNAMLYLFQCSSGGDPWEIMYPTLTVIGPVPVGLFCFFLGFIQIALLNLITGIFVERAMKQAQPDRETLALQERRNDIEIHDLLQAALQSVDTNNSGDIDYQELRQALVHPQWRASLTLLGVDIQRTADLFRIMSKSVNSGRLMISDFVERCMELRGPATSLGIETLVATARENERLNNEIRLQQGALQNTFGKRFSCLEAAVEELRVAAMKPQHRSEVGENTYDAVVSLSLPGRGVTSTAL